MKKEMRESQGVYAVHVIDGDTNTNYVYIGSGKLGDRVSGNPSKLRRDVHENKQLQGAYNKFRNCKVEILQLCESKDEARALENEYVDYYKRIDGVIVCNKYKACTTKKYEVILDKEKIIEIRTLLKEGKLKQKEIANLYGVNQCQISKIKHGKRWGNIEGIKKEVECTGIQSASRDMNLNI